MGNPTTNALRTFLCSLLPTELADGMMSNLESAISSYQTQQYSTSVLATGKFVEFAIRALEFLSKKRYTPLSKNLQKFTNQRLDEFANQFDSEPCKTLIPRTLFSMYCIRNKRGGIHVATYEPNRLDAAKLIHDMKWVIYELASITCNTSDEKVVTLLENFSAPLSQVIWDVDNTRRVLSDRLSCQDQILLLLSSRSMSLDQLRTATEYKNISRFRNIVLDLHKHRLINYHDGICTISPLGANAVEKIIKKLN